MISKQNRNAIDMATSRKRSQEADQDVNGRERLIVAALALFSEQGYEGTSVREIADNAGVSFGLIRKYFKSKEGLRDVVEEYVIDELQHFYAKAFSSDTHPSEMAVEGAAKLIKDDRAVLQYLRFALLHPKEGTQRLFKRYFGMYEEVIGSFEKKGQLNEGVDARWAAFLLMFMQLGPLLIEPFAEQILGTSIYSPKQLKERQQAYMNMLLSPMLKLK